MTIALAIISLFAAWIAVCMYGHGAANTIDQLAWWLHRFAVSQRKMHRERERIMQQRWVVELESSDVI